MIINEITGEIISASLKVHSYLGPGVLESAYHVCLAHELRKRGFHVAERVQMPIIYEEVRIGFGYQADMIVNGSVIVELKALSRIQPIHEAQLLSYLVLSGLTVVLLINFHEMHLRDGIHRLVHNFVDERDGGPRRARGTGEDEGEPRRPQRS